MNNPEGYVLVQVKQLAQWREWANNVAAWSTKADRSSEVARLKASISSAMISATQPTASPEQAEAPSDAAREVFAAGIVHHYGVPEETSFACARRVLALATQPTASNAGERTPQDFAIEHAEYMAQAAEYLITAVNDLAKAEQEVEEGAANDSDVDAARETLSENLGSVRNSIYEFRKRRDRAALATKPPAGEQKRCGYCDGTGDVHSIDGEWRGRCTCPAGQSAPHPEPVAPPAREQALEQALIYERQEKERYFDLYQQVCETAQRRLQELTRLSATPPSQAVQDEPRCTCPTSGPDYCARCAP